MRTNYEEDDICCDFGRKDWKHLNLTKMKVLRSLRKKVFGEMLNCFEFSETFAVTDKSKNYITNRAAWNK